MAENQDDQFQQVDPEDYFGYEERFIDKGGGGGSSSSGQESQGRKTRRAARKQQIRRSQIKQQEEAREKLLKIIAGFPSFDHPNQQKEFLREYAAWVNRHLDGRLQLPAEELSMDTSRSSGPGGQHVNKRETRVALRHLPSWIRAVSGQARTQRENRKLARRMLKEKLQRHLAHWRTYLEENQTVQPEMIARWLQDQT